MILGKDEGALGRIEGVMVWDQVCPAVVPTSSVFSCDESPSSLVHETPGEGFMITELLLEDLSLGS